MFTNYIVIVIVNSIPSLLFIPLHLSFIFLQIILIFEACIAVCKTARREGVNAWIKWPNDVWVGEKKISGLLVRGITLSFPIFFFLHTPSLSLFLSILFLDLLI